MHLVVGTPGKWVKCAYREINPAAFCFICTLGVGFRRRCYRLSASALGAANNLGEMMMTAIN
jgi:hypothetical protein